MLIYTYIYKKKNVNIKIMQNKRVFRNRYFNVNFFHVLIKPSIENPNYKYINEYDEKKIRKTITSNYNL